MFESHSRLENPRKFLFSIDFASEPSKTQCSVTRIIDQLECIMYPKKRYFMAYKSLLSLFQFFVLFNVNCRLFITYVWTRTDCDAPCFEQLKATHLRASPKQLALLDVLLQLIKTWPLTIGLWAKYDLKKFMKIVIS